MFRHHSRSSVLALGAIFMLAVLSGPAAQTAGSADPFSVWDYAGVGSGNPAAWGLFPDVMAFGVRGQARSGDVATWLTSAYAPDSLAGSFDFVYGMPGLLYHYAANGATTSQELTGAVGLGQALAMGLRFRWESGLDSGWGRQDIGLIVRPARYASVSIALPDAFDTRQDGFDGIDLGLSLRPLSALPGKGSMLTLSADARYTTGAFSLSSIGARFILNDWLSVSGAYDVAASAFGLGVSVALSGSETSTGFVADRGAELADGQLSLGQSMRLGHATKPASRVFASSVLVIDKPGAWSPNPPLFPLDAVIGQLPIWSGQAIAAINRAAADPSIKAIVMVEPPQFDSDARAQEFGRALDRFRAAGKAIYVYATTMDRLSYLYAASGARLVALDPNGSLAVVDVSAFALYFKDLLGKLGIDVYNLRSHEPKTAYNSLSESGMTEADRAAKARIVGGLASQGYAALDSAHRSNMSGTAASVLAGGPYLDPTAAVAAGLVDALMYRDEFDDRVDELTSGAPRVDIRDYARERSSAWPDPFVRRVAVVYLSGTIIDGEGVAGASIGESAADLLAALVDDATVAGVILRVDSGGGSALTSDHIARQVKRLKDAKKPVVVSMAGYAASGGYYIATQASRIFAEAGTLTGSIGVTGLDINATRMLASLGIGAEGVSASASGDYGNPFVPRRDRDAAIERAAIEYTYGRFVDVVAAGRGMDRAAVDALAQGQVWLGSEAVRNGLADAVGGLDDAKAAIEDMLGPGRPVSFADYLPGGIGSGPFSALFRSALTSSLGPGAQPVLAAARFAIELGSLGSGPLYLAPEYLYREVR